nr:T9SS type A sorting domain-containing protein [Bacteroidota bacterium]
PVTNGWNYFMYTYTDSNSCSNTAIDSVWVDDCLGINSANVNIYFMIAPNPTNDLITITTNLQSNNCKAMLYDMLGKELQMQMLISTNTQINLQGLSAGNYLLKVFDGDALVGVERVVKM